METLNLSYCPNCNEKFTEVYMLPCMHNFCSKCTDLMKNGAETTCLLCSSQCHQDEVKRNAFLEKIWLIEEELRRSQSNIICEICGPDDRSTKADKFCLECKQYMCDKCSAMHVRSKLCSNHAIVNKDDIENVTSKAPEPNCIKHETKLTIFCKTCDVIVCPTCFIMNHLDHDKSDDLDEVFNNSKSDVKKKMIEIDNIIESQNNLIKENKAVENTVLKTCDKVREEIESHAKELKDLIDNVTKANVDRITKFKNNFVKTVQANLADIGDFISSLMNLKLYFQEVINKGTNIDVFNSSSEMKKNNWIEQKKEIPIPKTELFFTKPYVDKLLLTGLILTELSKSLSISVLYDTNIDAEKNFKIKWNASISIFKNNFCTMNDSLKSIDMYENGVYQFSIWGSSGYKDILSTANDMFLYYKSSFYSCTYILKLKGKSFVKFKTLKYFCDITSTFQQTLLAISIKRDVLIELSANGDELKRITFPGTTFPSSVQAIKCIAYQLKDLRYLVTSYFNQSTEVCLVDQSGSLIKSVVLESQDIATCTDGEKYVFVLETIVGTITVFDTELLLVHILDCPGVKSIWHDKENDKVLLLKENEVVYFNYYHGIMASE